MSSLAHYSWRASPNSDAICYLFSSVWFPLSSGLLSDFKQYILVLVMGNLNTHIPGSIYKAFPPEEAYRILARLEIHYTPVHGSFLDMAEIWIHVMTPISLGLRVPENEKLRKELDAWGDRHNKNCGKVNWQFTATAVRVKLKRIYPDYLECRKERDNKLEEKFTLIKQANGITLSPLNYNIHYIALLLKAMPARMMYSWIE